MSAEMLAIQAAETAQSIPPEARAGLILGAAEGLNLSRKLWQSIQQEGGWLNACLVAGTIGLLPPAILGTTGLFLGFGLHQLLTK